MNQNVEIRLSGTELGQVTAMQEALEKAVEGSLQLVWTGRPRVGERHRDVLAYGMLIPISKP